MKLAWATDIHLCHAGESARRTFCQSVSEQADLLVVTGDIAESQILGTALTALASQTERPVYFVLGNHDFYHGSIAATRRHFILRRCDPHATRLIWTEFGWEYGKVAGVA